MNMNMTNWVEKSSQGLSSTERTVSNRGKLGRGEAVLPKAEHTSSSSSTKWSTLKRYIQVALYGVKTMLCPHWWKV